jgi:SAM-dependent methyltransferase
MTSMYARAHSPADLPWHQSEPPQLLAAAAESRSGRGRALDVGCGAGTFSIYLARRGFEVTALDVIPKALELGAALAREAAVDVHFVEGDLLTWKAPATFDLVLDSGCLHSLVAGSPLLYKQRLLDWLAPGSDYVLGHWGKRHALDWRPIGPRRRSRSDLVALFAPELVEHAHHEELMTGVPMPFGPSVLGLGIWFKRA